MRHDVRRSGFTDSDAEVATLFRLALDKVGEPPMPTEEPEPMTIPAPQVILSNPGWSVVYAPI